MPIRVQLPNGKIAEFPDGMSPDQITSAIQSMDPMDRAAESGNVGQAWDVVGRAAGGLTQAGGEALDWMQPDRAAPVVLPMTDAQTEGVGEIFTNPIGNLKNAVNRGAELGAGLMGSLGRGVQGMTKGSIFAPAGGAVGEALQAPEGAVRDARVRTEADRIDRGLPTLAQMDAGGSLNRSGAAVREFGKQVVDTHTSEETAANLESMGQAFERGFGDWLGQAVRHPGAAVDQALPSLVEFAVPGGVAGRGVRAGLLEGAVLAGDRAAARVAAEGGDQLAQAMARTEGMVSGTKAASEAAGRTAASVQAGQSAAMQGAQVRDEVLAMGAEQLTQFPGFAEVEREVGFEAARDIAARMAADATLAGTAAINLTTYLGAQSLGLNPFETRIAGGQSVTGRAAEATGLAGRAARAGVNAAEEAAGEFLQGAGEQLGQNVGMGAADSRVDPFADVGKAGLMEATVGGVVGAGTGLTTGSTAPPVQTATRTGESGTTTLTAPGAEAALAAQGAPVARSAPIPSDSPIAAAAPAPDPTTPAGQGALLADQLMAEAGVGATTPSADPELDALLAPYAPEVAAPAASPNDVPRGTDAAPAAQATVERGITDADRTAPAALDSGYATDLRAPEEADKAWLKANVDTLPDPTPEQLPTDNTWRYFKPQRADAVVQVSALVPSKQEDASPTARKRLAAAAAGKIGKRDAIDVRDNGDGTYTVVDGNGTLAAANSIGLREIPVRIVEAPKGSEGWRRSHGRLSPEEDVALTGIYERASEAHPGFEKEVLSLAKELGGEPEVASLKGRGRAESKIVGDYNGVASEIMDVVRGSLVFDNLTDAREALQRVMAKYELARPAKDALSEGTKDRGHGYRDALLNLRMPNGTIAELQIHVRQMREAKDKAHKLYAEWSELDRQLREANKGRAQDEPLRPLDAPKMARMAELSDQQRAIYDPAWEATGQAPASAAATASRSTTENAPPGSRNARSALGASRNGAPPLDTSTTSPSGPPLQTANTGSSGAPSQRSKNSASAGIGLPSNTSASISTSSAPEVSGDGSSIADGQHQANTVAEAAGGAMDPLAAGVDRALDAAGAGAARPRVKIVDSADDLPPGLRSQVDGDTDGLYDPNKGVVYLIRSALPTEPAAARQRAVWVVWHELAGHFGLRRAFPGQALADALAAAGSNPTVSALADAIAAERGATPGQAIGRELAVEEALAELAAALRTGDTAALAARWGVEIPAEPQGVAAVIARVVKAIKASITKAFGGTMPYSDTQVRELLEHAFAQVRADSGYTGKNVSEVSNEQANPSEAGRSAGDRGRGLASRGNARGQVEASERPVLQPLPGAPRVRGATGPDPQLVAVAEQYARDNGIDLRRQAQYADADPERGARIADAYAAMEHAPGDPRVRAAYADLIRQTRAQYDALTAAGYRFHFIDIASPEGVEYASTPWNAMRDIRANKTMGVFPTAEGFGSDESFDPEDNPLLADTGLRWPFGSADGPLRPVYANDLFRAVHDAFGHGLEGAGFRADGEENAWQAHVRLFTGPAVGAITSETRGQNSWLNFGPNGESNRTAAVEDTIFADQKTGLMPEWTWTEGRTDDAPLQSRAPKQTDTAAFKRWFGDSKVVDANGEPLVVYHGTTASFEAFAAENWGEGHGAADWGDGFYFASNPDAASSYAEGDGGNVMPVYLRITNPASAELVERVMDSPAFDMDPDHVRDTLEEMGHDGIAIDHGADGTEYIVFRPEQIKSATANAGTFDPSNPSILQSRRPAAVDPSSPSILYQSASDQTETEAFKRWSNDAPLVTSAEAMEYEFKSGEKVVVEAFHGTKRPDRIGTRFKKSRATSGPMAYFTSNPEVASNYATGKQDTSLSDDDQSFANWFKVKQKGSRSSVDLVRSWYSLTPEQKATIRERAPQVMLDDDGSAPILEPGNTRGLGSYDYNLTQTQRGYDRSGNPLAAMVEDWLNSGAIFNEEQKFMEVLELVGFPMETVTYDSPHAEYPSVYKTHLAMQSPLVTTDIPQDVVDALNAAAKRDRSRADEYGADHWDKRTRTLRSWVQEFNEADNDFVWTSIPDKVTAIFKAHGYDGIVDMGGKQGGAKHKVYIPFDDSQVKSATANRGTFDPANPSILQSRRTPAEAAVERAKKLAALRRRGYPVTSFRQSGSTWAKSIKDQKGEILTWLRRHLQDRMIDVRDAQEDIEEAIGTRLAEASNLYRAENLMHGKAADGVRRVRERLIDPLKKAVKDSGLSVAEIERFLWAQHALERNKRIAKINPGMPDGGSGLSNADANAILAAAQASPHYAQLQAISQQVQDVRTDTLNTLRNSGQITPEQYRALRGMYQHYVPLRGRVGEEGEQRVGGGRGIDMRGKPVQRALGRSTQPANILGELVGDAERAQVVSAKAEVGRTLLRIALQHPNPDFWQVERVTTEQRFSEATGEVYTAVVNDATDEETVIVKHNGIPYRVRLVDPDLRAAMKNLGVEGFEGVGRFLGWVNRWLSAVFTRYNPAFVPINMIRDMIMGGIGVASELGGKALAEVSALYPKAAAGLYAEARGQGDASVPDAQKSMADWAREFMEAGAATGYQTFADPRALQQQIENEMAGLLDMVKRGKPLAAVSEAVRRSAIMQTIETGNEIIENSMRLSVYVHQRRAGKSKGAAAEYAKNLTVNFNRKGSATAVANALFLFFNASMQGSHRTLKLMRDPRVLAGLAAVGAAQFAMAVTLGAARYEDEDETLWEQIPDHVRQKALVIPLGYDDQGGPQYVAIPMPFGFNMFSYVGGYPALLTSPTWRSRNDVYRKPLADIARAGVDAFSVIPIGDNGWYFPTVMRIFANLQANRDDLGRRIRDDFGFEKFEGPRSSMGKADTPSLYKGIATTLNRIGGGDDYTKPISNLLDWAPEDIEYLMATFTGGPGTALQQLWRSGERAGAGLPTRPDDLPVTRRIIGSQSKPQVDSTAYYGSAETMERGLQRLRDRFVTEGADGFYALREELGPQFGGVELAVYKRGSADGQYGPGDVRVSSTGAPELEPAPGSTFAAYKDASKAVRAYGSEIRRLQTADMDRLERRRQIDQMQSDRAAAMRQFIDAWNYDVTGQ